MTLRLFLLLAVLLSTGSAAAKEAPPSLAGVGRVSVQAGWRLTTNNTFYTGYYGQPGNTALERAPTSPGGPFAVGSFAYSFSDFIELGVDLFATGEQLRLTGQPTLTTLTYGALVGIRFQTVWNVLAPEGVVPFIGLLSGPTLAYAVGGDRAVEVTRYSYVGSVGATFRFDARWGLTLEYRLAFVRGLAPITPIVSSYNAGGNWLSLGLSYSFPPEPSSHPFQF